MNVFENRTSKHVARPAKACIVVVQMSCQASVLSVLYSEFMRWVVWEVGLCREMESTSSAGKKRVLSISQDIVLRDDYVSYMRTSSSTTYVGFRRQRTKPKYFRKLRKGRELKYCLCERIFLNRKNRIQNTSRVLQQRVLWLYRGRDNSK